MSYSSSELCMIREVTARNMVSFYLDDFRHIAEHRTRPDTCERNLRKWREYDLIRYNIKHRTWHLTEKGRKYVEKAEKEGNK